MQYTLTVCQEPLGKWGNVGINQEPLLSSTAASSPCDTGCEEERVVPTHPTSRDRGKALKGGAGARERGRTK